MRREARFPDDPAEPFWWGRLRCWYCDEREIALAMSGRPGCDFVCMGCGATFKLSELSTHSEISDDQVSTGLRNDGPRQSTGPNQPRSVG